METKKAFKTDKVKRIITYCPLIPKGSIFIFGKIGAGKSSAMMTLAQRYHDYRNLKVFDIWGGERNQGENLYWVFPSPFKGYWDFWKKNLRLDEDVPKQYKVNILYPMLRNMPKKVPYVEGFVFYNVFRIPIKTITTKEIRCVIGNLSISDETLWEDFISKIKDNEGPIELTKLFEKSKSTNTSIYKNFVKPLVDEGLLCSMDDEMRMDIVSEMKDKETITVLAHHYISSKFDVFLLSWFLFRIWDLLKDRKIPSDMILPLREASKFFRASDKSVLEDKYKIFKKYLDDFLRYARGKMHFLLDTQSPAETKGFLDGNQDLSIIGLLPGSEDRSFATDQFKRDGCMIDSQIKELAELEPGEYFFIYGKGKLAEKKYLILPRTAYWREKDGNFYEMFESIKGKQFLPNISHIKEECMEKEKERLKEINELENKKQLEIKIRKEEEKKRQEEKAEKEKLEKYRKEMEEKKRIRDSLKKNKPAGIPNIGNMQEPMQIKVPSDKVHKQKKDSEEDYDILGDLDDL